MPDASSVKQERKAWRADRLGPVVYVKLNPWTLPHGVWSAWQPALRLKFSSLHFLTRLLLSKSPSAHAMICFQGKSRWRRNGWFITPSSGCIVEPCHLNFRTLVPFLFTLCLPSAPLQVLLWGDVFCSLSVWLFTSYSEAHFPGSPAPRWKTNCIGKWLYSTSP